MTNLVPLEKLTNLEDLWLSKIRVNDLTPLSHVKSLKRLYLDGVVVTDLTPIMRLPNLIVLSLRNTPITNEQLAELHSLAPTLKVLHEGGEFSRPKHRT